MLREMGDAPLTDDVKDLVLDQLIDAEQAVAGLEFDDDAPHFAGYYQHVDDGEYGDLHLTQQEGAALQAAVAAPLDEQLVGKLL